MTYDTANTKSDDLDDLKLRLARAEVLAGQAKTALGLILAVIGKAYTSDPLIPLQPVAAGSDRMLEVLDNLITELDAGTQGHWRRVYELGARQLLSSLLENRQVLFDTQSHTSS